MLLLWSWATFKWSRLPRPFCCCFWAASPLQLGIKYRFNHTHTDRWPQRPEVALSWTNSICALLSQKRRCVCSPQLTLLSPLPSYACDWLNNSSSGGPGPPTPTSSYPVWAEAGGNTCLLPPWGSCGGGGETNAQLNVLTAAKLRVTHCMT